MSIAPAPEMTTDRKFAYIFDFDNTITIKHFYS